MITYALYDCLAVTYLHHPTMKLWNLSRIRQTSLHELMTPAKATQTPVEYEDISDDEQTSHEGRIDDLPIHLLNTVASQSSSLERPDAVNDQNCQCQVLVTHSRRSFVARHRRNQKRNRHRRKSRFIHQLSRAVYHRFTMNHFKTILRQLHIDFLHVKRDPGSIIIGFKSLALRDSSDERIPQNLFDRAHYLSICRFRWIVLSFVQVRLDFLLYFCCRSSTIWWSRFSFFLSSVIGVLANVLGSPSSREFFSPPHRILCLPVFRLLCSFKSFLASFSKTFLVGVGCYVLTSAVRHNRPLPYLHGGVFLVLLSLLLSRVQLLSVF